MPSIASSKVTMTTILSQRKAGPGNETLKKRKEQTAFYNRFQPLAGPGKNVVSTSSYLSINRIYNKILDRDWFSPRLFVT